MKKKIGWVSYLSGDEPAYVDGVRVLTESLRRTGSKYDMYCLCVGVDNKSIKTLKEFGVKVIKREPYPFPEHFTSGKDEKLQYWNGALNKLQIFSLYNEFEKFVYLDSDMMAFKNIDHLFQKQDMTASEDAYAVTGIEGHKNFNAGLMVVEPDKKKWETLEKFFNTQFSPRKLKKAFPDGGSVHDQLILNLFFKNWKEISSAHLLFTYNFFSLFADDYKWSISYEDIFVAHYTTRNKPFMKHVYENYPPERKPRNLKEKLFSEYIAVLRDIKDINV